MISYTLISIPEFREFIEHRIAYHKQERESTLSWRNPAKRLIWAGHTKRMEKLQITLDKLVDNDPCSRSCAQLFSKGYRLCKGLEPGHRLIMFFGRSVPASDLYYLRVGQYKTFISDAYLLTHDECE